MRFLILTVIAIGLLGCASISEPKMDGKVGKKVSYTCPMDTTFQVEYAEDGKSVKVYDAADQVFDLKSTDGIIYKNDKNASIQHKDGNLIVEIMKGYPIVCKEYKN